MPETQQHLVSIGHLCERFQRAHHDVLRTLRDSGIEPRLTLNEIDFFECSEAYPALERAAAERLAANA